MRWRVLLIAATAAACSNQLGTVVRQVHVEGRVLVVERCFVNVSNQRLTTSDCVQERVMLPRELVLSGCPARHEPAKLGLTKEQVRAGVDAVQNRTRMCAPLLPGGGTVRVRLEIGRTGVVMAATLESGSAELAACLREAFDGARFPTSTAGAKATVPIELPP